MRESTTKFLKRDHLNYDLWTVDMQLVGEAKVFVPKNLSIPFLPTLLVALPHIVNYVERELATTRSRP